MQQNSTIDYYNRNFEEFYESTVNANLFTIQEKFLKELKKEAYILDFGCGSGRDTKYFLESGYKVDAVDGCENLCSLASKFTGVEVKNMLFKDLAEVEKYDAIWACSSILHLPSKELIDVMKKCVIALKNNGIMYTSFKYGTFQGERNGRFFTDMTETTVQELLTKVGGICVKEQWITSDVRPKRGEEKWLNLILKKTKL